MGGKLVYGIHDGDHVGDAPFDPVRLTEQARETAAIAQRAPSGRVFLRGGAVLAFAKAVGMGRVDDDVTVRCDVLADRAESRLVRAETMGKNDQWQFVSRVGIMDSTRNIFASFFIAQGDVDRLNGGQGGSGQ